MNAPQFDSRTSWVRLSACLALSTVGGVGLWSPVVVLPSVQSAFGVDRGAASLSYTVTMIGVALGSVVMGRLTDRRGIALPVVGGSLMLASGYVLAGLSGALWQFCLVHGVLIGLLGSSLTFGPLLADISKWFMRRRGIAVAICASGNYVAGAFWPPVVQHLTEVAGWRATYIGIGVFCAVTMLPLTLLLRGNAPSPMGDAGRVDRSSATMGVSPGVLQGLLVVAGFACCIAMSTPQVHLVAYCGDLGYGAQAGAEMLSLMLALGIISRVGSGWLADRIGGMPTLLLGSTLQGLSLALYVGFDGLGSLYAISALFGLVQGGLIPSYAVVIRECFPAREAGMRVGLTLMATMLGMAAGGWMAGAIDDWTGSYRAAFAVGVLWNALNIAIVLALLLRRRWRGAEFLAPEGSPTSP